MGKRESAVFLRAFYLRTIPVSVGEQRTRENVLHYASREKDTRIYIRCIVFNCIIITRSTITRHKPPSVRQHIDNSKTREENRLTVES